MLRTAGFVLIACFALSALSLPEARKSKPSATVSPASDFDPTPKTTTTTVAPNTTTTTVAPNTTTTTVAPKPTTKSTTTVAPKPTTKSTTTAAPTTAPPSPTPPVGDYNLTIGDKTCLRAKVALQIRLANKTFTIQPNQTHLNGSCDETRVALYFNFSQGFINFNFTRDVGNKTVYVDAVGFTLNYPLTRGLLTDARYSGSNTSLHLFPAKIGHSYSCKSDSLYMGKGLYLDITNDQMQAFNLTKNDFGSPDFCPADQPDYRVAIAVGVVLLVLIIVVVVAYLLSRRKRMEGYQSL